ncbi:hypothetical protein A3E89_01920 [Candidatus Campbellbacteria bacterium RIFCSPHIGHO2_12_FULL_35_10]|uniref:Uncharacterized protein n=1 Tax=Candidatus Campbellbacteria bacterium RIFCSPHIGHO2_12_FULL_35_10 TaxID=1797578 RepID=A0A1F5EQH8_9BACT|nr:MAG: hypothetical protein A3E89_01920 [Candidatus Campbellbacteria bacterium RIFCSPHIGHO2_12_FULL_35_10]
MALDKDTLEFRKQILDVFSASLLDCNYDGMSDREKRIFVDVVVKRDTLYHMEKLKLAEEERNLLWDMLENSDNIKNSESFSACFNSIKEKWLCAE